MLFFGLNEILLYVVKHKTKKRGCIAKIYIATQPTVLSCWLFLVVAVINIFS